MVLGIRKTQVPEENPNNFEFRTRTASENSLQMDVRNLKLFGFFFLRLFFPLLKNPNIFPNIFSPRSFRCFPNTIGSCCPRAVFTGSPTLRPDCYRFCQAGDATSVFYPPRGHSFLLTRTNLLRGDREKKVCRESGDPSDTECV